MSLTITPNSQTQTTFGFHCQSNTYGATTFDVYFNGSMSVTYTLAGTPLSPGSGYYYCDGTFGFGTPLSEGTTYSFIVQSRTGSTSYDTKASSGTTTFYTADSPIGVYADGVTTSQFTLHWTNGGHTTYQAITFGTVSNAPAGANSYLWTGLSLTAGITYYGSIKPYRSGGTNPGSSVSFSFTVPYPAPSALPSLTVSGIDGYGHLAWGTSSGATKYRITWSPSTGASQPAETSSNSIDISGTNGTTYTYTVIPYNVTTPGTGLTRTAKPSARPDNFYWTYSKDSEAPFTLGYIEWSNFKNVINGFRKHTNTLPWQYPFSTSPTVGQTFTANMYTELRAAVVGIAIANVPTRTKTATINSGGTIYGFYFTDLSEALNVIT